MKSQLAKNRIQHYLNASRWRWNFVLARTIISRIFALACLTTLLTVGAPFTQAQTLTTLYTFQGGMDGQGPSGRLVSDEAGNLYGTTSMGGAYGNGTVFELSSTGSEKVLYSFQGGTDGARPNAGLARDSSGNLYGTTINGGIRDRGTVFKVTPDGVETVLYRFRQPDGVIPYVGLVMDAQGNLYGTTALGGDHGWGTVFKITPTGTLTVLHSFEGEPDGHTPYGGVILDAQSNIYGTTSQGGGTQRLCNRGCGTAFKISGGGSESVLYAFLGRKHGNTDGRFPSASLVFDGQGNLYGTTYAGGDDDYGTVFELTSSGTEKVICSFFLAQDYFPMGPLVLDPQGNLYGVASGGAYGWGTIFKLSPSGTETVLYSFADGSDGGNPAPGLMMDAHGNLYGTTYAGGPPSNTCGYNGCGTVFKLIP